MRHLTTFKLIDAVARTGSIRKAAEIVALTPSALHRRVQAFENELGEQIFERLPHGVRLNAAGEIIIHHMRNQLAETDRVMSKLADLSGMRRGHVSIACSQALSFHFLPREIAKYREKYPAVSFEIHVLDHIAAQNALTDYTADIAFIFDAVKMADFEVTLALKQDLLALMAATHPLASKKVLRLRDCMKFPLALPTQNFGGRLLLQKSVSASSMKMEAALETNSFEFLKNYVLEENAVTFQIPIGLPEDERTSELVSRPIDTRDVFPGTLYFGQKRERTLPVASARFADQILASLNSRFSVAI